MPDNNRADNDGAEYEYATSVRVSVCGVCVCVCVHKSEQKDRYYNNVKMLVMLLSYYIAVRKMPGPSF